jgi:exodeoxyribonuclease VII small subunit
MAGHAKAKFDFESALAELENIVASMESGQMSLDQALDRFQRGTELLRECQKTLNAAEQRIQILEGGLLRPFENTDTSAPERG